MADFYVKPEEVNAVSAHMSSQATRLSQMSAETKAISGELAFRVASVQRVRYNLRMISEELKELNQAMVSMEKGLVQVKDRYIQAENNAANGVDGNTATSGVSSSNGMSQNGVMQKSDALIAAATAAATGVSQKEKKKLIKEMEKKNPKYAKAFKKFLTGGKNNQLTDKDIVNIKYLVYTSEEPYRSIFLTSLTKSRFKIKNADSTDGTYYRPLFHTLNYAYPDDFEEDPRGAYTTVFHECGHAVDDLSEESKWWGADTENFAVYSKEMDKKVTLKETIEYDVYYNEKNPHSVTSIANQIIEDGKSGSEGNVSKVIKALKSGDKSKLGKEDLKLYNAVINQHRRNTAPNGTYEAVSDVYGGVSKNALCYGYGHDTSYWNDSNNAGSELWAEYFSYNMTGSDEKINVVKEFFPESAKVMDKYAKELVR